MLRTLVLAAMTQTAVATITIHAGGDVYIYPSLPVVPDLTESKDHSFPLVPSNSPIDKPTAEYFITSSYRRGYLDFNQQMAGEEPVSDDSSGLVRLHLASTHEQYTEPNYVYVENEQSNSISYEFNLHDVRAPQSAKINIDLPLIGNALVDVQIQSQQDVKFQMPSACKEVHRLNIHTEAGKIDLHNTHIGEEGLVLTSSSGNIVVGEVLVTRSMMMNTVSGDLSVFSAKVSGNAFVRSISGDVEMRSVDGGVSSIFNLKSTSGDIVLARVKSKDIVVNTKSGDIRATNVEAMNQGQLHLKAISGDVTLENAVFKTLEVETTSGDVKIFLQETSFRGTFEIRTTSGTISVHKGWSASESLTLSTDRRRLQVGRVTCADSGPCPDTGSISIKTTSGDVHLYFI